MKARPLIFSASIGQGHQQAAKALYNELEEKGYYPKIIDTFYKLSPLLHHCMVKSYLNLLKLGPAVWRKIYFNAEKHPYFLYIDRFSTLFTERLHRLIAEEENVPFIISTNQFVTPFLTTVKKKKNINIPIYYVITDFLLHPAYLREEIDRYFTADPTSLHFAKKNNFPTDRFSLTGIPVPRHPAFSTTKSKSRENLQLDEHKKVVLIAGGGFGLTKYAKVIHALEQCKEELLIICMTGTNSKAAKKLNNYKSKHSIKVIPFTDRFLEYLRASDVVISKSGGLTMSEALICETPIIIYKPVPGHEEHNAQYLVEKGAAVKVQHDEELPFIIKKVLFQKKISDEMRYSARKIKKPTAAEEIIEEIILALEQKQQAVR
ncbi:MGDG synthase family glycosyltransferase [Alkalihalobacterium alkalinitrilicum]|uniref:MGDG synthase family glycosyltransferase n=1 Tax=Alkalihalobacterium alkalinitrilicum TaxID=427920 RepID=UPI000995C8AE|nr:glycosyltransferase [Alkalihalobacterium alkalinitrilicum]